MDERLVKLSAMAEQWLRQEFPNLTEGGVAYLVPKMNKVGLLVLIPAEQKPTLLWGMVREDADRGDLAAAEVLSYFEMKDRRSR